MADSAPAVAGRYDTGSMTDCCIIGGGIIGLSIARELAGRGHSVRVLARDEPRATSSWAAAGIFPPAPDWSGATPNARLTAFSDRLHRAWAAELRDETGIDNELQACGGLHLARDAASLDRLAAVAETWRQRGTVCEWLTADDIVACEPVFAGAAGRGAFIGGMLLPEEQRIRPPRHLAALERSCALRGVAVTRDVEVCGIETGPEGITGIRCATGECVRAGRYVLAAGPWTESLGAGLGLRLDTRPIRGQILLLSLERQVLGRVVNRGLEYLVPRDDGRLLVGSTLEDAGFDRTTTPAVIERLGAFCDDLLGDLPGARVEQVWAGLRPGSADGLPTIGPVPGCGNAFVAAGHFRAGLHQSPGTAVIVADLIEGRTPPLDPSPFAADRPPAPPGPDSVAAMLARAAAESG